jgi:hypothetical protein
MTSAGRPDTRPGDPCFSSAKNPRGSRLATPPKKFVSPHPLLMDFAPKVAERLRGLQLAVGSLRLAVGAFGAR